MMPSLSLVSSKARKVGRVNWRRVLGLIVAPVLLWAAIIVGAIGSL